MKKLALSDDILMQIDKPARYIGNEFNSVIKNPADVDIRFAMCFPDVYEVGMSHLGIAILYDMLNRRDDTYCERVYSPWPDLHKIMKDRNIPLFALESQDAIKDFDFIGMTLQYEMCYTNILQILDLAGLSFLSKDRKDGDPIVIVGGPCATNPEPIADFVDIVYVGEGETSYNSLLDLYKECKAKGLDRMAFLRKACQIPGIYVPAFYEAKYNEDGTIKSFGPIYEDVPAKIVRQVVINMDESPYPTKMLIPFVRAIQDRVVLEIQRGCIRGCRFCQAGMIYRPNREKSVEVLKNQAKELLASTGHEEISLSSLSSSDYHALGELMDFLINDCLSEGVNVSLPSLRIDAFSLDVMSKVQDVRKSSITFAPEAGSQRMRDVINKGLTVEDIIGGAHMAFEGGWNKVKLYFMLGLPTETDEDMQEIPRLANEIAKEYYATVPKDQRQGKCQITISTSFFVPKPFTPFQWAPMYEAGEYLRRAKVVNDEMKAQLNAKSLKYNWHHSDVTVLEGVFARGDRRLAPAILDAYLSGCYFDAWGDFFDFDKWLAAFEKNNISIDFYAYRQRDLDEIFPWDFIDCHVTKDFLKREWNNAMAGSVTKNCKMACNACGCLDLNTGVCHAR
ncbi:MAG: TIGR03960 family B12-binding radical SAM protein [Pseudobutyrivibrio sp.]|nr:TIGR03960 family B12-binding radical SAM protein [Pseudobutyrivibrio sp.]